MRLPVITIFAIILFLVGEIFSMQGNIMISRVTILEDYRTKFHIEPKISADGLFVLSPCSSIPPASPSDWVVNQNRTFRAFLKKSNNEKQTIIVLEQAQPRMCYELKGDADLNNDYKAHWPSLTTLAFVVNTISTVPEEYLLDIKSLSYTHHPIDGEYIVHTNSQEGRLID